MPEPPKHAVINMFLWLNYMHVVNNIVGVPELEATDEGLGCVRVSGLASSGRLYAGLLLPPSWRVRLHSLGSTN